MDQRGWICPLCSKALAPWVAECDCHRSTTGTGNQPEPVTLESPNFRPPGLDDFEARGFKRINRNS